jgi:hypothetical protein
MLGTGEQMHEKKTFQNGIGHLKNAWMTAQTSLPCPINKPILHCIDGDDI